MQPCPVPVCALPYRQLPSVTPVTRLFTWWITWRTQYFNNKQTEDHLSEAWGKWRDELRNKQPEQRWKMVNGPTSAVIAHLWDWGWVPAFPGWWARPPGEAATLGRCAASDALLVQQVTKAAEDAEWAKAARHHGGKGLEHETPSFVCIEKAIKTCRNQKALQVAKALRNVAAGGALCGSRFQPTRRCFRCHHSVDTWKRKFLWLPWKLCRSCAPCTCQQQGFGRRQVRHHCATTPR